MYFYFGALMYFRSGVDPLPMSRAQTGSRAGYIGSQANFELRWALDLHTTIAINLGGFITEGFLKGTDPAGNVVFSNIGITYGF